jgi:lipid A 3-O-deacylase
MILTEDFWGCSMIKRFLFAAAAVLGLVAADSASADEVFGGIYGHNVTFVGDNIGIGAVKREDGVDFHIGYRTERFDALWFLGKPAVHAFVSINSRRSGGVAAEGSDFAAVGFDWPIALFRSPFYIRPGIGLAYTDGQFNLPPSNAPGLSGEETQRRLILHYGRLDFGDPWQFEPELAFGYHLSHHWSTELSYTHISNGQIFHHGKNEGLDDAGLRLNYKF